MTACSATERKYATRQIKVAVALATLAESEHSATKAQGSANQCAAMAFVIQVKTAPPARATASAEQAAGPVAAVPREPVTTYVIPIKKILPVQIAGHPIVVETAFVRERKTIPTVQ